MRSSHAAYRPELRRTGDPRSAPLPPGDRPPAERIDGGAAARAGHPDAGRAGTDSGLCVGAQRLQVLLVVPLCLRRGPAAGGMALVEQVRANPATAPTASVTRTATPRPASWRGGRRGRRAG